MNRSRIIAIALLGVALAASAAARPGIYEYFKAGTKRSRAKADLPSRSRARQADPSAPAARARAVAPWTEPWFSDSTLVRRHLAAMTEALTVPMIGETYPLPRGGGFVCSTTGRDDLPAAGGVACRLRCAGPELGGRRDNWFYAMESSPALSLDRVRWLIPAPPEAPPEPWRALVRALADSLSSRMGPPHEAVPDGTEAAWAGKGYSLTMRLHGAAARVDSLEIECVSDRLGKAGLPRKADSGAAGG